MAEWNSYRTPVQTQYHLSLSVMNTQEDNSALKEAHINLSVNVSWSRTTLICSAFTPC